MTEKEKREAIQEFFLAPKPHLAPKAMLIGSVVAFLGLLALFNEWIGFGLLLITAGAVVAGLTPLQPQPRPGEAENEAMTFSLIRYKAALRRYEARPGLAQMVEWLKEGLEGVADLSEQELGLDEVTRDPVKVFGPLYGNQVDGVSASTVLRRKVASGYFYSTYRVSIFQFTDYFLGAYQGNYSMIKHVTTGEEVDEFFYRDVVAVRTKTEASNYTLKTGEKLEHSKTFSLTVSSGDRIEVVINDPKMKSAEEVETLGDEAINNVRAMLRQYKLKQHQESA